MRHRGFLVVLGVCLLLSACHFSVSVGTGTTTTGVKQARIDSVALGSGYKDGQATGQATVFAPTFPPDSTFHAVVQVSGGHHGTTVKATWTAVDAGGETNRVLDEKDTDVPSDGPLDFNLTLPRPWPTGAYKVDIYLNGTVAKTVNFTVQ